MQWHLHSVGIFVLVHALAGSVQAQTFNALAAFGGSLSDSGNLAPVSRTAHRHQITTNPDPAGPGILAQAFGAPGTNSCAGGSNHASDGGRGKIGFWVPEGSASVLLPSVPGETGNRGQFHGNTQPCVR